MEINGLEQAIEEFNACNGAASIYYNRNRNEAWTLTFYNDVQRVQTMVANEDTTELWTKGERDYVMIGTERTRTIKKIIELFLAGEDKYEIYSTLVKEGYSFF